MSLFGADLHSGAQADNKFRPWHRNLLTGMLSAKNNQFNVHDKLRSVNPPCCPYILSDLKRSDEKRLFLFYR